MQDSHEVGSGGRSGDLRFRMTHLVHGSKGAVPSPDTLTLVRLPDMVLRDLI